MNDQERDDHLRLERRRRRTLRLQEMRDVGACIGCQEASPDHWYCAACSRYRNRLAKALRTQRLREGRCSVCVAPVVIGKTMCQKHMDMHTAARRRREGRVG